MRSLNICKYNGGIEMISKKLVRMAVCLMSALLIFTALPLCALADDEAYDAVSTPYYGDESYDYIADLKIKNQSTKAIAEYIYASYAYGNPVYKGTGQCYGYAEMIRKMFGKSYRERRYGIKATKKNLYNKLKDLKPGTHVRFSAAANGSRNPSHSIVLLRITKNTIWYTDGSYDYNNGIRIDTRSLADLAASTQGNGYKYLVFTREPKGGVSTVNIPEVAALDEGLGNGTMVAWRPVSGAKKYIVYRSTKKKSGYKKIATVKKNRYTDKSKKVYGRVYYKIKAVKAGGKKVTSKAARADRLLTAPKVYMKLHSEDEEPWFELYWKPVKGATKYKIYTYNYDKDKYVRLATVKGKKWIHRIKDGENYFDLYITASSANKYSESLPECISFNVGGYDWDDWEVY